MMTLGSEGLKVEYALVLKEKTQLTSRVRVIGLRIGLDTHILPIIVLRSCTEPCISNATAVDEQ